MRDIQILFLKTGSSTRYQSGIGIIQKKNIIEHRFKSYQAPISGKTNLAQRVIKILTTQEGSNRFFPYIGTDLISSKKPLTTYTNVKDIRSIFEQALIQTEFIIKAEQTFFDLTFDELLDKLDLVNIYLDANNDRWVFQISIKTLNGTAVILEI